MADTIRTTAFLLTSEFQDGQPPGSIIPQYIRDLIVSLTRREIMVALSDEITNLAVGTSVITFRMPLAINPLSEVRLNCNTAPVGGPITVDVKLAGVSIFSTKPTIAAGALTSVGGTPAVISTPSLPDDGLMTVDINGVGPTTPGKGLKITFIGQRA